MDDNNRAYVSMAEKVDADLLLYVTELAATAAADVNTMQPLIHAKIDEILQNDALANQVNTGQATAKNTERDETIVSTRRVIPFLKKFLLKRKNIS